MKTYTEIKELFHNKGYIISSNKNKKILIELGFDVYDSGSDFDQELEEWPYLRGDADGQIVQSSLVLGLDIFELEKTK